MTAAAPATRPGARSRSRSLRSVRRPRPAASSRTSADGRVLMVAYLDAEALAATLATGEVHFHSRSRDRLWRKGETSGNVLALRGIALDCDGDALLLTVDPAGPTCHRGTRSCFDPADGDGRGTARSRDRPARPSRASPGSRRSGRRSPTGPRRRPTGLVHGRACSRVASTPSAARSPRRRPRCCSPRRTTRRPRRPASIGPRHAGALAGEAADLVYHSLVLLAERDLAPAAVIGVAPGAATRP